MPNCDDDCSGHDDQYQHHADNPVAELQHLSRLLLDVDREYKWHGLLRSGRLASLRERSLLRQVGLRLQLHATYCIRRCPVVHAMRLRMGDDDIRSGHDNNYTSDFDDRHDPDGVSWSMCVAMAGRTESAGQRMVRIVDAAKQYLSG